MDMTSKSSSNKTVGVIGAGSFGTAVANILSDNTRVLLYARSLEALQELRNEQEKHKGSLNAEIVLTTDLQEVAENCNIIFPVVPSANFREMMKKLSPFLHPYHILIHGTKGLDIKDPSSNHKTLNRDLVRTMSEVIREESVVVRVGCLAGPNLAKELADKQPAATVVASRFNEVIKEGQRLLRTDRFQVYGSKDLIGVELCGVLKNIIAIGSGALSGMGLGENARALLISRGMVEMIYLGKALGGNTEAFIGLAGVGDLVATCSSTHSRNFTVGYRLAQGDTLENILATMEETAEGVNTIRTVRKLAAYYNVRAPITQTLHKVLFEGMTVTDALHLLMKSPFNLDVDFL